MQHKRVSVNAVSEDDLGFKWRKVLRRRSLLVSQPLAGVKDPETGVTFPDLNSASFGGEAFQTNLIFPEPCEFIAQNLPACAVIRPSLTQNAGAVATAIAIAASHIFDGQPQAFFTAVLGLAMAADAAKRGGD